MKSEAVPADGRQKAPYLGFMLAVATAAGMATAAYSQSTTPPLSTYGTPGLVELPTAQVFYDGALAFNATKLGSTERYNVTFQVLPRVYGTFRYSYVTNYDRSFDIHFQLANEGRLRPALAIGLRDFLGTGIFSSEYFVATKSFGSRVQVTGGIGWGRLTGRNSFDNPLSVFSDRFDNRKAGFTGTGGQLETGDWFRGPASLFGGLSYKVNDQLSLMAEYSPDLYSFETRQGIADITTPLNIGLLYRFKNGVDLKGFVVGGNEIGAQLSYVINPAKRSIPGGLELAPVPVGSRARLAVADWNNSAVGGGVAAVTRVLRSRLEGEGLELQGYIPGARSATIRIENQRWDVEAQAAGRAARIMAETLPPEVEEFRVVFQKDGVPNSRVVTQRSDLEEFQYDYDGAWRTFARADIQDAAGLGRRGELEGAFPRFDYSLSPYAAYSFFDPDQPIRVDVGPQLKFSYKPLPGLNFSGRLRYPIAGNIEDSVRLSNSKLPAVRTDAVLYARESDLELNTLTAEYIWRPGENLFARATAGYLENMYGGVSAELLWYPVNSRLALGVEANYAKKREYDILFGFRDYDVLTGHASAYYDFGNGFVGQIDAGRYLAGDWGATFSLDREFNNGFTLGGFFTLTDVPFDQFGEGSFDKGLKFEVPLSWFTGKPSKTTLSETIRPILRDGGARLNVNNRLFGYVRDERGKELRDGWGRYLR